MSKDTNKSTQEIKEAGHLFSLGAHLGHKKNRLHPKSRPYIYSIVNGTTIINLEKTVAGLEKARAFLSASATDGKTILIVATKKTASSIASELARQYDIPVVSSKWLPGFLTNFDTIMKNVKKLITMKQERDTGAWDTFVKHERIKMNKEIAKLERLYGGLINLSKRPDIIVVFDIRKEKNAIDEAHKYNIKIVGLVDTNANPELVDYPIVSNDDAVPVLTYMLTEIVGAYAKGIKKASA